MDFKDKLTLWTAIFNIIVISISGQIIIEDINSRASAGGRRPSLPSSTLSDRAPTYSFLTEDLSKAPLEPEVSSAAASKPSGISSGNFAIPSAQRRPNPFLQRLPSAAADQEALFQSKSQTNSQPSAPPVDTPTFQNGQSGASATQPMYPNQPDPYQTGSFQGPFNSLNSNNNKPPTMAGPVPADRISYQPAPTNTVQSGYQQPVPGPQSMQVPGANSLPAGPGYNVQNPYGNQQSSQMYPPQQQMQDPQFATQYQSQSQYPQYSQPQQGMQQPMTLNSPAGPVQTPNFNDPSGKGYDAYGQPQSPYAPSPYDQQPQAQPAAYQQPQTGAYTQAGQPQQPGAYTQAGQPQSSVYTQPGQPQTGAYQQQYVDPNQQYQTQQQSQSQYPQYQQPAANPAPPTQTYVDPNVPIPRMPGQQTQPQGAPAPAPAPGQPPAPAAGQYPGYPPQTPPGYPPQAPPGYPPQTQYYDPSQPQQPYYATPGQQPSQQYVQAPGAYPPQQAAVYPAQQQPAATYPAQQQPAAAYPAQQQPAATYPAQQQPAATYQQQQPGYPQQQYQAQPPAQPGYPPQSQQQVYQQPGYPPQPGYPQQQPQAGGYQPQRLAYPQPQQQQQYPFSSPAAKFPGNNPYGQQSVQYPQAGQAYPPQGQPGYPPPGPPGQQAYAAQAQQSYSPQGQQSYSQQGQQTQNQMPMRGKAQIQELLSKIKQAQIHSVSSTKTAEEKNKWNAIFRKLWDIYLYWSNLKPGNKASNSRGMMKA